MCRPPALKCIDNGGWILWAVQGDHDAVKIIDIPLGSLVINQDKGINIIIINLNLLNCISLVVSKISTPINSLVYVYYDFLGNMGGFIIRDF